MIFTECCLDEVEVDSLWHKEIIMYDCNLIFITVMRKKNRIEYWFNHFKYRRIMNVGIRKICNNHIVIIF